MKKILNLSLSACILVSFAHAEDMNEQRDGLPSVRKAIDSFSKIETKDVSVVGQFKAMFTDGKVTGQVRSVMAGYEQNNAINSSAYASAVGGTLKYELASLNGFNAAFAFVTSQDVGFATGEAVDGRQNDELSSSLGNYTALSEAYLNYKYDGFNLRLGRQTLDTPLADSDDIRMILNTFEAYVATYEISDLTFTLGNVRHWQGYDAGLDDAWVSTGDQGTWLGGLNYAGAFDASAWHYDVSKQGEATKATYLDVGAGYEINENVSLYASMQYLREEEVDASGVEANIYGALVEVVLYDVGINVAYNKSAKKADKRS